MIAPWSRNVTDLWKSNKTRSLLQTFLKFFLSIPVTSVFLERTFGEAGPVFSKLQKRLRPVAVASMIHGKCAQKMHDDELAHNEVSEEELSKYLKNHLSMYQTTKIQTTDFPFSIFTSNVSHRRTRQSLPGRADKSCPKNDIARPSIKNIFCWIWNF